MISEILMDILAYILFTSFILCFFGGSIYMIIGGIREYLEEADSFDLFVIIAGSIGALISVTLVLKAFGL